MHGFEDKSDTLRKKELVGKRAPFHYAGHDNYIVTQFQPTMQRGKFTLDPHAKIQT